MMCSNIFCPFIMESLRQKCPNTYFPVFGLNREIYSVNLCIQFKYGKIWTRTNLVFVHFSHTEYDGANNDVFNMGKFLIHHSVLRDYMLHFLKGNR